MPADTIHAPSPQHAYVPSTPWANHADEFPVQSTPVGSPGPAFEPLSPSGHYAPPQLAPIDTSTIGGGGGSSFYSYTGGESQMTLSGTGVNGPDSPMLVSPERASDYAKMSMSSATPPPSNVSITTYFSRFVDLARRIQKMPWMGGDRVTVDYYPGKGAKGAHKRKDPEDLYDRRNMRHVTTVSWKSRGYIAWRQSHYGHIGGGGGGSSVRSDVLSEDPLSLSRASSRASNASMSLDSLTAIIEPFPFITSDDAEVNRNTPHV
jgi:hypothetical protein